MKAHASDETKSSCEEDLDNFRKEHIGKYAVILGSYKTPHGRNFFKRVSAVLDDSEIPYTVIKNFEGMEFETPRKKLHWFLSGAKFVIADDSMACGEIMELEYCRHCGIVTAILTSETGDRSSWMTLDCDIHSKDFRCFEYGKDEVENYVTAINEIRDWVDKRLKKIKTEFEKKEKMFNEFSKKRKAKMLNNPL